MIKSAGKLMILMPYCICDRHTPCFLFCKTFSNVQSIRFSKLCFRSLQFCLLHTLHENGRQPSTWTNNSTDSPNSCRTRDDNASTSAWASFTFKYQGTV